MKCDGLVGKLVLDTQAIYRFQPSVAFHIETNYLFCSVKQMDSFYTKCNYELK